LLFLVFSCAKKMPPPGKPDISPPKIQLSDFKFNSINDTGFISLVCKINDNSKISRTLIYIGDSIFYRDTLNKDSFSFDCKFYVPLFLKDSLIILKIESADEWDNVGVFKKILKCKKESNE